ncbi:MAG: hypothetical protein IT381_17800 [Deltaproteobacteria bacterium]|nr:hypothetical protein [Deltaproteobacteria bacterium]
MRLTMFVVVLTSAALAGAGYYLGSHPELLGAHTGAAALDATNAIAARFGQTRAVMLVARAREGTIVDAPPLKELDALNNALSRSGACKNVLSFFALPQMVVGEEETEIRNMVEKLPANETEREDLRRRITGHENAIGELVSPDLKRALFVCQPLDAPAPLDTALAADRYPHLQLTRVGPSGLATSLANDLVDSALFFVVLALVISITGRPLARMRPVLLAEIVLFQAALVYLAHPIIWPIGDGALSRMLGPSFDRTQRELDEVTAVSRLVLVSVTADLQKASAAEAVAKGCITLREDPALRGGKISCPTDVLVTMAGALTGEKKLPANDDQLKALWFFAGDRPELSLIFTPDRSATLVRLSLAEGADASGLDARIAAAFSGGAVAVGSIEVGSIEVGGMPMVDAFFSRARAWVFAIVTLLLAGAFFIGRALRWANVSLGEAWLAPALLVKIGVVSRVLLVLGLLVLFASVGGLAKRAATKEPS